MSYSQPELNVLHSFDVKSGVVMDCETSLNELGFLNSLTYWVAIYKGHVLNERSDCLANIGVRQRFINHNFSLSYAMQ